MSLSPNIPNCPLTPDQQAVVAQLLRSASPTQTAWLAGYLSAVSQSGAIGQAPPPPDGAGLTILFGTQTGNSEGVAKLAAQKAVERGIRATVKDMGAYKAAELKKERFLMVVVSTHGEGDPPDTVEEFYEFVHGKRAPKLPDLKYTVLALGDTSYEQFCQIGVDFDTRFQALGATAVVDRVDCDVDYDDDADAWIAKSLDVFTKLVGDGGASSATVSGFGAITMGMPAAASVYTRKNPFPALILNNINLSGAGSKKENRHVELSLEESGLVYQPGDSLGVFPSNCPELVDSIIKAAKLDADAGVETADGEQSLRQALLKTYEITVLTPKLVESYANYTNDSLQSLLGEDNRDAFRTYIDGRELIDLIVDFPPVIDAQGLVGVLRKMPHRLYSLASSLAAYPDEAHLLIATVRYEAHDRVRKGVASTFFADRVGDDTTVPVYVHENSNFHMPADSTVPLIMIGPGTGVAPFRAFMQEREERGASGRNWLFFGDQHFRTDFAYQIEWQRWLKDGLLTRIDVAFSRDQAEKIYVQHRMREHGKALYAWLEEGASVYVCGDETHMAKDVHAALIDIVRKEAGKSADDAEEYVKTLQRDKRYLRDVY